MVGFVIGTVCLIALAKMACGGRHHGGCHRGGYGCDRGEYGCHRGGYGCGHREHHEHGGHCGGERWDRSQGMKRFALRRLFERLDTTPGQEKVIAQAADEMHDALHRAWRQLRDSRADVAQAMKAESFDEAAFGAAFARQDEAITEVRKALMGVFARVHEALDPRQRAIAAELIAQGPRGWARAAGPYRG
jgi:Spy/CpxP family protein refolding chaperone